MKVLRGLFVVVVVLGGYVFLGHGWQAAVLRQEELKTQLAHERLIRIVEPTLDVFSQHDAPDKDYRADLEDVWWLCYNGSHKAPLGQNIVHCEFEPKLAPYIDVIQDFPNDWEKRSKHITKLMADRTVRITVIGFESGDEFLMPEGDGRGKGLYDKKLYDPVVKMKFVLRTATDTEPRKYKMDDMYLLRYSRPKYDFLGK